MPFGLKNTGTTYQRLMDKVLAKLMGNTIKAYVDDIVVKTSNAIEHCVDLQCDFNTLCQYQLKLNT